jgi:hypothetical protein
MHLWLGGWFGGEGGATGGAATKDKRFKQSYRTYPCCRILHLVHHVFAFADSGQPL